MSLTTSVKYKKARTIQQDPKSSSQYKQDHNSNKPKHIINSKLTIHNSASPSTIPQLTQDLALSQMCPITGKVNFVNNCPFDLHIWRYDSSVDKAAVLSAKNTFSEPIRQDFRSGLLGYKVATDGRAVHDGYAWLNLNYRFVVTKNHANGLASVGAGFTNPLEGYSFGTSVSLGPNCKELHSSENGTLKMKSVECDEPTFKGQVDYEFCT